MINVSTNATASAHKASNTRLRYHGSGAKSGSVESAAMSSSSTSASESTAP
jgi:hypothetical protein